MPPCSGVSVAGVPSRATRCRLPAAVVGGGGHRRAAVRKPSARIRRIQTPPAIRYHHAPRHGFAPPASTSRDSDAPMATAEPKDQACQAEQPPVANSLRGQGAGSSAPVRTGVPDLAVTVVSLSGGFMVFWCLAPFPGSIWAGIPLHDDFVHLVWQTLPIDAIIGPESLMLKYNTLGNAPALLHALPGAVWCALGPLQLAGPGSGAGRKAHSIRGRVMLASAAVLMLGYALIDGNGLTAEEYDFGGDGGRLAEMIDSSAVGSLMPLTFHKFGLKLVAAWFLWTGAKTAVSARGGDLPAHQAWAVRHLGAGLWVAAQRPLFSLYRLVQFAVLGQGASSVPAEQADAFYNSAYAVTLLYFLGSEALARGKWSSPEKKA